jgi:hypothetical protein
LHTCDPSVLRIGPTYYLYYGGLPQPGAQPQFTALGVAQSTDGYTFTRARGGTPIATVARPLAGTPNAYGLGQPSAVFVAGYVYLFFSDTTGIGANTSNGGGQFVLRSTDPTFAVGVEELTSAGFMPYNAAATRAYSVIDALSPDVAYSDVLGMFAIATNGRPNILDVRFYKPGFPPQPPGQMYPWVAASEATGAWTEGPGFVRGPDGHLPQQSSCGALPLDIFRSTGPSGAPDTWDLSWSGWDIDTGVNCPCKR